MWMGCLARVWVAHMCYSPLSGQPITGGECMGAAHGFLMVSRRVALLVQCVLRFNVDIGRARFYALSNVCNMCPGIS